MPSPTRFVTTLAGFWLVSFGVLRSAWAETALLLPLAEWQLGLAEWYGARPEVPVAAAAACSGADVMALCVGVVLAYPAPWRRRLHGVVGGLALIVVLNTIRVGTLAGVAGRPRLFEVLHVYVWPLALVLAVGIYVWAWLRHATGPGTAPSPGTPDPSREGAVALPLTGRRFVFALLVGLVAFGAAAPWLMTTPGVARVCTGVAGTAAALLSAVGLEARATGAVLLSSAGGFVVTPECLVTPVIAVYAAAVWSWVPGALARGVGLLAALPLFALLAVARVLAVALPGALVGGSPLFAIHGFFQFLLAVVLVAGTAHWAASASGDRPGRRAALALAVGLVVAAAGAPLYTAALVRLASVLRPLAPHVLTELSPPGDAQGALFVLPAYQMALLAGLLLALGAARPRRRAAAAFGVVALSQFVLLVVLGETAAHLRLEPHAMLLRGWAVAVPVAVALGLMLLQRRTAAPVGAA